MNRYLKLLLVMLVACIAPSIFAAEYGSHPENFPNRLIVQEGTNLNVRSSTSTNSEIIGHLKPGDVVYTNPESRTYGDGYHWLCVIDTWDGTLMPKEGYVVDTGRFYVDRNPYYGPMTEEEQSIEYAADNWRKITTWILLALCIIAALFFEYAYFFADDETDASEKILGEYHNGMRRTFFFNVAPYRSIIMFTLLLIAAVVSAVAVMLVVGGVVFGVLWIVKILCYIVVWVGIILCVISIICCLVGQLYMLVGVAIGGMIWHYDDQIEAWGEACADTGLTFLKEFNMLGYTADLFMLYWKPMAIAVATPLAIFLALAAVWLVVAGLLIGYEKIVTSRYNIKHPCPHCQRPSEPATYLSLDPQSGYLPLPDDIRLRPGMYGLFHITHPRTGERMPTMLANGRDSLARECGNCGRRIQAEEGTELHIGMTGLPQSGKSTLTYRLVAEIMNRGGEERVSFTDVKNSISDREMLNKITSIRQKGKIDDQDLPAKTNTDHVASMQLLIQRKNASVPYRLFINDVGGELFNHNDAAQSSEKTRFFGNLNVIMFMLDPITTDFSDYDVDGSFKSWLAEHESKEVAKLQVRNLQDTIDNQILQHGNQAKRIHLDIVLPKLDLGYIPASVDLNSQEDLTRFLVEEMGLGSLINWAKQFKSVTILPVSAVKPGDGSHIKDVVATVIEKQLDIDL